MPIAISLIRAFSKVGAASVGASPASVTGQRMDSSERMDADFVAGAFVDARAVLA
jgi:hypothetical protein